MRAIPESDHNTHLKMFEEQTFKRIKDVQRRLAHVMKETGCEKEIGKRADRGRKSTEERGERT